jgi:hypothetical protein
MICVYGICEAPVAVDDTQVVTSGPLAAIVRDVLEAPTPDRDALVAHETILEQVMAVQPVLPVRFGTTVASADAVVALLDAGRDTYLRLLDQVRGCVEVSVRIRWDAAEGEAAPDGVTYLHHRRAEREQAQAVHTPLAEHARASTFNAAPGQLVAAYLIPREDLGRFTGRLESIRDERGLDVSCTGPWPPYSFVESP